jgi:hypothetical protein
VPAFTTHPSTVVVASCQHIVGIVILFYAISLIEGDNLLLDIKKDIEIIVEELGVMDGDVGAGPFSFFLFFRSGHICLSNLELTIVIFLYHRYKSIIISH